MFPKYYFQTVKNDARETEAFISRKAQKFPGNPIVIKRKNFKKFKSNQYLLSGMILGFFGFFKDFTDGNLEAKRTIENKFIQLYQRIHKVLAKQIKLIN